MFIDSHCHIDFPEFTSRIDEVLGNMASNKVTHALCVCVNLEDWPRVQALAAGHDNLYASVGVHPDHAEGAPLAEQELLTRATDPKVVAIGETGLDYFRLTGDLTWQQQRFRTHIQAARVCRKPLIIHTREAAADTLRLMREENAQDVGGVMHCFTEAWEVAQQAMELGFYISLSGIVTFKNAVALKEVARQLPLDRMLIETDSPYLAPVPYRGKTNEPAFVKHVAEEVARIKGISVEEVAEATTANFFRLFNVAPKRLS
ncbi:MAG: TatD family hydrolase [Pseudomonadota bacterium]